MSEQVIFYTNPMSRGQIVRWMLEEVGAEYVGHILEYGPALKSAEYLAINPMGKIPAVKHGSRIVTECAAICAYLADAFPKSNLAPAIHDRADYYRWMFFGAGPLESAVTNRSLGFEPDEKQQMVAGYGNYKLTLGVLDDLLSSQDYICGDDFSAADVYIGSQIDFGLQFGSIDSSEAFVAYADRLRLRAAYKESKQKDMALMPKS